MSREFFRDMTRGFLLGESNYGETNEEPDRMLSMLRNAYSRWDESGASEAVYPSEKGGYSIDLPHPSLVRYLESNGWSTSQVPGGIIAYPPL